MFIFSKNGENIVNSDNAKNFYVLESNGTYGTYIVSVDGVYLGEYSIKDDAVKEMHEIIRQIEAGMTSYQLR